MYKMVATSFSRREAQKWCYFDSGVLGCTVPPCLRLRVAQRHPLGPR
jgi:hypothetical protein